MENPERQVTEEQARSVNVGGHQLVAKGARLDVICAGIEDPETLSSELCRLIALEIALLTKSMLARGFTTEDIYLSRAYGKQVKALRELSKQIKEAEAGRRREDVLNFDGEKFKFVLGKVTSLFVKAMKEAGVAEDLRVSVMTHHRDIMAENEPLIRRETKELGKTS